MTKIRKITMSKNVEISTIQKLGKAGNDTTIVPSVMAVLTGKNACQEITGRNPLKRDTRS